MNWYKPFYEVSMVFSRSLLYTLICQHPLFASSKENIFTILGESMQQSINAHWYNWLMFTVFSPWSSTQNREVPSFLWTTAIGEAHSVCAGSINLIGSILSISSVHPLGTADQGDMVQNRLAWLLARITCLCRCLCWLAQGDGLKFLGILQAIW